MYKVITIPEYGKRNRKKEYSKHPKRDAAIIKMIYSGKYSVKSIAEAVGLSRLRISHIIQKWSGEKPSEIKAMHSAYRKSVKNSHMRYSCVACGEPVFGNLKDNRRRKYCHRCISGKSTPNTRVNIARICDSCGNIFKPTRYQLKAERRMRRNIYCSKRCFLLRFKRMRGETLDTEA